MNAAEIAKALTLPIRQQDGTVVELLVADTKTNRLFKDWLFHNDRGAILAAQETNDER